MGIVFFAGWWMADYVGEAVNRQIGGFDGWY
jgi:hypothetical protein